VGTPPMSEVGDFFKAAIAKFYYQDFFDPKKVRDMVWPNETIKRQQGRYQIQTVQNRLQSKGINDTPEVALSWFREDIVDGIASSKQPTCSFLLGAPGSGKSTLLKFLINTGRDYSELRQVVFSRFESTKFFKFCEEEVARKYPGSSFEHTPLAQIIELLSDYFFSIVLRDLILSHAYSASANGLALKKGKFFGDARTMENFLFQASELVHEVTEDQRQSAFYILLDAMRETSFDHKRLFEIDFPLRVAMTRALAFGKRVCVIFDGLDILSPEDEELDHQKYEILKLIMKLFGLGMSHQRWPTQPGFDHHAIILLRPNTYFHLIDQAQQEIRTADVRAYEIAPLSPHVVLFRAIKKGLRAVEAYQHLDDQGIFEIAETLFSSLDIIMRSLGITLHVAKSDNGILGMFNGNIRDCFDFMARILYWVREEADSDLSSRPRLSELIKFISSPQARGMLSRKGYRLIELLLFFETSTFQNAMDVKRIKSSGDPRLQDVTGRVSVCKNYACRGLVDNVFNYHSFDHKNNNDNHNLLQKVRILQVCCRHQAISEEGLRNAMTEFGYDLGLGSDIGLAIMILRYAGFLNRFDEGREKRFTCTTKGRVVMQRLMFQGSYLEHVYHKTLLPKVLMSAKSDSPRSESHPRWTVASIRNYFTLLTYIRFIENNVSRSKEVPRTYRIYENMRASVVDSIRRIVTQDYLEKRSKGSSAWFATMALQEIQDLLTRWSDDNLIADEEVEVSEG